MRTSSKGVKFIQRWESCRLKRYTDRGGVPTIGYGHTAKNLPEVITAEQALTLLRLDIYKCEVVLNEQHIWLSQCEYDALISFIFNVGSDAFKKSTLLKRLKSYSTDDEIRNEFMRWVYDNGKVVEGLKRRRDAEANLYCTGMYGF